MVDILIDALTNSIRRRETNEVLDTQIVPIIDPLPSFQEWQFDWLLESKQQQVYQLTTLEDPNTIQGLISLAKHRGYIFVNLVENAPFNIGQTGIFEGVGGNLFAFACKTAFDLGFEGFVSFDAKTRLIKHYEKTLFAKRISYQRMIIDTSGATKLVNAYFKTN
jgi:hypothetical protein